MKPLNKQPNQQPARQSPQMLPTFWGVNHPFFKQILLRFYQPFMPKNQETGLL